MPFGYFHGHEVGGTNPSLLEALGSTDLNLVLDVKFNKEVCQNTVVYWSKKEGSLAKRIDQAEKMSVENIKKLGMKAKERVAAAYSWDYIAKLYKNVFTSYGEIKGTNDESINGK